MKRPVQINKQHSGTAGGLLDAEWKPNFINAANIISSLLSKWWRVNSQSGRSQWTVKVDGRSKVNNRSHNIIMMISPTASHPSAGSPIILSWFFDFQDSKIFGGRNFRTVSWSWGVKVTGTNLGVMINASKVADKWHEKTDTLNTIYFSTCHFPTWPL